jgi:nucleoside-diphosphate-sugar epimerase
VHRFIFASSSSVYGVRDEENVTEELSLQPLTDYSKYKALCEDILLEKREPGFTTLALRPATVCGYSPRLRLDLTVNILTNHAVNRGQITVFGGTQKRPNIHIEDVTDLYVKSLQWSDESIDGKIFNAGYENHSVQEIAEIVRSGVGGDVAINVEPTDDLRSYHISSELIRRELGYEPARSLDNAVADLTSAFRSGSVPDSLTAERYYNIKTMQALNLK